MFRDLSEKIHFVGIGGASMSALALFLAENGHVITGSDNNDTTNLFKNQVNIKTFVGHNAENVGDAGTLVYTRAVGEQNPEVVRARDKGIRVMERAELLGIVGDAFAKGVAVAGTHGKTTTTSLISTLLIMMKKDPTVMVGGKMQLCDSNFVSGKSDLFVYEACEYHDAFLHFHPFAAVILNIELDHPDYFKSYEQLEDSFAAYAANVRDGGFTVVNGADAGVKKLLKDGKIKSPVTFGIGEGFDVFAADVSIEDGSSSYTLCFKDGRRFPVRLGVGGRHNLLDSLAAFAVIDGLGFDVAEAVKYAADFVSPKRRYELVFKRDNLTVIDDFAHHPTELAATLSMARAGKYDTVIIIFQPHTYTRTAALLDDFAKSLSLADHAILLPIYAAREKDIYNVSSDDLAAMVKGAESARSFEEAGKMAMRRVKGKTVILTVGAGDVYKVWEWLK